MMKFHHTGCPQRIMKKERTTDKIRIFALLTKDPASSGSPAPMQKVKADATAAV